MKQTVLLLLVMLFGIFSGIALYELSLRFTRGNPRTALYKDPSTYFDYEIYKPAFRRGRDENGRTVRVLRRSNCAVESFACRKPPSVKRIFVIGESTAGTFSASKWYFQDVLREQIPSFDFEVVNCSMGGYDSSRIVPVADEVLRYEPDLLLVFMGNNLWDPAVWDPWLASAVFRVFYEHSWLVREFHSRLLRKRRSSSVSVDRVASFRDDYEHIVREAKARGIPVVLFQLPANFAGYPPLNSQRVMGGRRDCVLLQEALEGKDYLNAMALLWKMKLEMPADPYADFMMGKVLEKQGRFAEARERYLQALVLDAVPGSRCEPGRNRIIRALAEKYDCPLVDVDGLFTGMAEHGLVGDEFFQDNCHWLTPLNKLIIEETMKQLHAFNASHERKILADNALWKCRMPFVDPEEVRKELREKDPAFAERLCRYGVEAAIQGHFEQAVYYFQRSYRLDPSKVDEVDATGGQVRRDFENNRYVAALAPRLSSLAYRVWYCKGEMYRRNGEYAKALSCFRRSIQARSDQPIPYLLAGLACRAMGNEEAALSAWKEAVSRDRTFKWLLDHRQRPRRAR